MKNLINFSSLSDQPCGSLFRIGDSGPPSEMSDVYSFGVFLLELITGGEALRINFLGSGESLNQWVHKHVLYTFSLQNAV